MNFTARGVCALVACAWAGPVWADDLTPPPWRFNPGTTVQHWDFSAGAGGGGSSRLQAASEQAANITMAQRVRRSMAIPL